MRQRTRAAIISVFIEVVRIELIVIALVAAWVVGFAVAAARLAERRRRRTVTWAFFGAILGPVALLLLNVAPPGHCWKCSAPTTGWLPVCLWCGENVHDLEERVVANDAQVPGSLTVIEGTAPPHDGRRGGSPAPAPDGFAGGHRWLDVDPQAESAATSAAPAVAASADAMTAASASGPGAPGANPVERLRTRLQTSMGGTAQAAVAAEEAPIVAAQAPLATPARVQHDVVLASAIYVTGSRGLEVGGRYGIAMVGDELRILGPVDVNPTAIAMAHPLDAVDATGYQGRLIITGYRGRRESMSLAFMSIAGNSAEGVADALVAAAADVGFSRP